MIGYIPPSVGRTIAVVLTKLGRTIAVVLALERTVVHENLFTFVRC